MSRNVTPSNRRASPSAHSTSSNSRRPASPSVRRPNSPSVGPNSVSSSSRPHYAEPQRYQSPARSRAPAPRSKTAPAEKCVLGITVTVGFGIISLPNYDLTSLEGLGSYADVKTLFLQKNYLENFHYLEEQPLLKELILDSNNISTFAGACLQPKLEHISMKNNPVTAHPLYRVMCIQAFGTSLRRIDGAPVLEFEREQARSLGPFAARAVRAGWLADANPRTESQWEDLIRSLETKLYSALQSNSRSGYRPHSPPPLSHTTTFRPSAASTLYHSSGSVNSSLISGISNSNNSSSKRMASPARVSARRFMSPTAASQTKTRIPAAEQYLAFAASTASSPHPHLHSGGSSSSSSELFGGTGGSTVLHPARSQPVEDLRLNDLRSLVMEMRQTEDVAHTKLAKLQHEYESLKEQQRAASLQLQILRDDNDLLQQRLELEKSERSLVESELNSTNQELLQMKQAQARLIELTDTNLRMEQDKVAALYKNLQTV